MDALYRYWADHPPAHLLLAFIAAQKGYQPRSKKKGSLEELISMFDGGVIKAR